MLGIAPYVRRSPGRSWPAQVRGHERDGPGGVAGATWTGSGGRARSGCSTSAGWSGPRAPGTRSGPWACCPGSPLSLDIVGDGCDRGACEALARQLGLGQRVRFHGWLPRERIDAFYRDADVFVFPSYREPGGNVTFEAMGHGLPLVVSDRGGPGTVVDETCGIRVHPDSPDQYAQDLASAVGRLVREPALRLALGQGARRRVAGDRPLGHQGPADRAGLRGGPGAWRRAAGRHQGAGTARPVLSQTLPDQTSPGAWSVEIHRGPPVAAAPEELGADPVSRHHDVGCPALAAFPP